MSEVVTLLFNATIVFIIVIVYTRIFGLRSYSKMSNFDFAITIAIGSVIASIILNTQESVLIGLFALLLLYALKLVTSYLQSRFGWFNQITSNKPILLMFEGEILYENLKKEKITKDELIAKLREANVMKMSEVRAVVLETTGDVSVLHGEDLEDNLLYGVST